MKKFIIFLAMFPMSAVAGALDLNPFFGDKENQVHFMLGQGFDSGELILFKHMNRPVPYYMAAFAYSQPNTFFRLPGRQSINLIKTVGFGKDGYFNNCRHKCDWNEYDSEIFMLSQDFAVAPWGGKFYVGSGAGVAVQGRYNERLNTKFLLGFRMLAGYKMNDSWNLEFIMQHFSNGDTGTENGVYNFYAFGISYSF